MTGESPLRVLNQTDRQKAGATADQWADATRAGTGDIKYGGLNSINTPSTASTASTASAPTTTTRNVVLDEKLHESKDGALATKARAVERDRNYRCTGSNAIGGCDDASLDERIGAAGSD